MMIRENTINWKMLIPAFALVFALAASIIFMPESSADTEIQLIADGKNITTDVSPMIKNDRMLVPIRVISEEMGAEVTWNNQDRTVFVEKGNRSLLLQIDKHLVEYSVNNEESYGLSDVAPLIVSDRTLVPVRLVSNALGVGVHWDENTRTVTVSSSETSDIEPFFDMKITSVNSGQTITGKTNLQSSLPSTLPATAEEIRYMLLDPGKGSGFIIAKGNAPDGSYQWLPSFRDQGNKVLVAAIYDKNKKFIAGDAIPVHVNINPEVKLLGIEEGQVITDTINLMPEVNFSAAYVKYEIINNDNGRSFTTAEQDPLGTYIWTPEVRDNGNITIKVTAYTLDGQAYPGQELNATVNVSPRLSLTGVRSGQTIDKPVTLNVSRNFDVSATEYFVKDVNSGAVKSLYKVGYGGYIWFPGPEMAGKKEVYAQVTATNGVVYTSNVASVNVPGTPKLILQGTGPEQVITPSNPAKLKVVSNIDINSVKYIMTNRQTGAQKIIGNTQNPSQEITYTPASSDGGSWRIKAEATYSGGSLTTENVPVTVYTGTIYSAKPIIEQSKFLDFASKMASDSWKETGMSAALQTAQSILETGWGQSVPVDKYNGKLSNNLFGIKGAGSAGSVISNTWEEYNGVAYRVDDKFRAYKNPSESWADHKTFLLARERYEPFTKVMYDSSLGAWALKRAGYATDSLYAIKLMNLIQRYDLEELDKVSI